MAFSDTHTRVQEAEPEAAATTPFEPIAPRSIEETGLSMGFLSDLILKILYFESYMSGYEVAEAARLPFKNVADRILAFLKQEHLIEVKRSGAGAYAEAAYEYVITAKGGERAREILDRGQYAGPAPVTLESYAAAIQKQTVQELIIGPEEVQQALSHLVLSAQTLNQIGPAVNSSQPLFLFGHPGNGKTTIAEAIGSLIFRGEMYIPYAVEVNGQIIKVFDGINHQAAPNEGPDQPERGLRTREQRLDNRWIRIRRPVIITGGELTLESLELAWDATKKIYEAPLQMKANGGMLLIDDFGRQQVRPRDLLNRWIVPLEKRLDYLTLQTGNSITIPFEMHIIFATNLEPRNLVDEAFLRRIRHRIRIQDPTFDDYQEIFRQVAASKNIPYDEHLLAYLWQEYYLTPNRSPRSCHPRDILEQVTEIARYLKMPAQLTRELLDQACSSYFVDI